MSDAAIELKNISKSYGGNHALKNVSLSLRPGELYVLLGKNGAGKSTLMRVLMRYEPIDSGSGRILGRDLHDESDDFNLEIGYVSEAIDYVLPLKMKKLFTYFARIYPRWDQRLFESLLSELRIDLGKYFRELSRGQKMQVAFAAALAIRPKILLLDEITAVLDANARSFFMGYLGDFTRQGGTVVMATNIVSEVQNHAGHLVMLGDGQVNLDVPVSRLPALFVKVRRLPEDPNPAFRSPDCVEVGVNSDGSFSYVLPREGFEGRGFPADCLDHRGITAEDIFIYYTRNQGGGARCAA